MRNHHDDDACFVDHFDHVATPAEACREYVRNVGMDNPSKAWILTDYDTWERNPFFVGPECELTCNPESRDESWYDLHVGCHGDVCKAESFNVNVSDCYIDHSAVGIVRRSIHDPNMSHLYSHLGPEDLPF